MSRVAEVGGYLDEQRDGGIKAFALERLIRCCRLAFLEGKHEDHSVDISSPFERKKKKKKKTNDSYSNNKDVGFKKSQKSYGTEEINKENPLQHAVIRRYQQIIAISMQEHTPTQSLTKF